MNNNVQAVYLVKRSRKLPSGKQAQYWVLRWADSRGKMRSESIGKVGNVPKREAEKKRREKETALGSGRAQRDRPHKITLKAFLEMDREAIAGDVAGATLIEHDHAKKHALDALGENAEVTSLTYADVGRVKKHLSDAGRSAATISKTLRLLRAALNRGVRAGIIHDHPFRNLQLPRVESRSKRIFTQEEVEAMVHVAPSLWWRAFIRLAATSGLRKDELLNLQWHDVDLDEGIVRVQPKQAAAFKTNGQTLKTWKWRAKAKASYRTIPLPKGTVKLLRKHRAKQGDSPYIFLDLQRVAQLQSHIDDSGGLPAKFDIRPNLLRDFRVIQTEAADRRAKARRDKVYEWRIGSVHDLRRTFCTFMANHVPMHVLREWAGHADIATTAGFYLGMADGMAERARQAWAEAG